MPQMTKSFRNGIWTVSLVLFSLLSLVPFLWMVSTSLKTRAEVFTYPPVLIPADPQWHNYIEVFEAFPFARYALNTAFVTITVTILQTLTSAMAAYAFARLVFPGRDRLFLLYLGTLMIPSAVTLIPSYILMTDKFPTSRAPRDRRGTRRRSCSRRRSSARCRSST